VSIWYYLSNSQSHEPSSGHQEVYSEPHSQTIPTSSLWSPAACKYRGGRQGRSGDVRTRQRVNTLGAVPNKPSQKPFLN